MTQYPYFGVSGKQGAVQIAEIEALIDYCTYRLGSGVAMSCCQWDDWMDKWRAQN